MQREEFVPGCRQVDRPAAGGRRAADHAVAVGQLVEHSLCGGVALVAGGEFQQFPVRGVGNLAGDRGGSVLDGSKFVAAAVPFEGDTWSILEKRGSNITRALPMGAVLTLPATGSEMNSGGVVTRKATHAKLAFSSPLCFPQFSVLDPTKTYTLPPRQIANGLVDAFVHTMEQYLTYPVNALAQMSYNNRVNTVCGGEGNYWS